MRQLHTLWHWLQRRWPTSARLSQYVGAPNLAIALDPATVLVHPARSMRLFPPALHLCGGSFPADFGRTVLIGAGVGDGRLSSSLGGIGKSKLSSLLGDVVSFALHDDIVEVHIIVASKATTNVVP